MGVDERLVQGQGINRSVSGITTGDVSGSVVVANKVVLSNNGPEDVVKPAGDFELTEVEVEILERLDLSQSGLLTIRKDDGFAVEIDSAWVGGPYDERTGIDAQVHEALERLAREGLLRDIQGNGQTYYLSSKGRAVAQRVQMPQGVKAARQAVARRLRELGVSCSQEE